MLQGFKCWQLFAACLFLLGAMAAPFQTASAQIYIGGALVYGADIKNLGLQANGHLVVNEENKLRVGANLTFFFPEKTSTPAGDITTNLFAINVDGHYMFVTSEELILYAIGGLNLSFVEVDAPTVAGFVFDASSSDLGINLGGGVEYTVQFGRIFGELKYTVGGFDQLQIDAGVRIPILGGN